MGIILVVTLDPLTYCVTIMPCVGRKDVVRENEWGCGL